MISRYFLRALAGLPICLFSLAACQSTSPAPEVSAATGRVTLVADAPAPMAPDRGRFVLSDWGGPDIPVWTYVPIGIDASDVPIVIVMHGTGRDADRYRDEWRAAAQLEGFVVAAPEFSDRDWETAAGYNLGNVFREEGVDLQPEAEWAFSAIEQVFDAVRAQLNGTQTDYILYGHSAGSQFVHRFLFYKPDARVNRYIAANAGWYTMPLYTERYPYGLEGSEVPEANLRNALQEDVVILLGTLDNDPNHRSLRRAPEAMRQGPHRFARGIAFHQAGKSVAETHGVPFNWRVATVEGAVHANGQMIFGAVPFITDPVFIAPAEEVAYK